MGGKAMSVAQRVPVKDLTLYFLRLGFLGFGGPVALVGQMERELVGERHWLTKEEMREAVAVCQSLPGPLAIQVGIFICYLRGVGPLSLRRPLLAMWWLAFGDRWQARLASFC